MVIRERGGRGAGPQRSQVKVTCRLRRDIGSCTLATWEAPSSPQSLSLLLDCGGPLLLLLLFVLPPSSDAPLLPELKTQLQSA